MSRDCEHLQSKNYIIMSITGVEELSIFSGISFKNCLIFKFQSTGEPMEVTIMKKWMEKKLFLLSAAVQGGGMVVRLV